MQLDMALLAAYGMIPDVRPARQQKRKGDVFHGRYVDEATSEFAHINYFGAGSQTEDALEYEHVLSFTCILDLYPRATVDLTFATEDGATVIYDCHDVLVRCPDLFEYRNRVLGFDEDAMARALRKWCKEVSGHEMAPVATIDDMVQLGESYELHLSEFDSEGVLAWIFNRDKVCLDVDGHVPATKETITDMLEGHGP